MEGDTPASRALSGSILQFRVVRTERPNSVDESAGLQGIEVGELLRTIADVTHPNDTLD
jgi:hypothetical protein